MAAAQDHTISNFLAELSYQVWEAELRAQIGTVNIEALSPGVRILLWLGQGHVIAFFLFLAFWFLLIFFHVLFEIFGRILAIPFVLLTRICPTRIRRLSAGRGVLYAFVFIVWVPFALKLFLNLVQQLFFSMELVAFAIRTMLFWEA
ncbi:hypothetical protein MMC18_005976 [Xylographa bjoerkii]|nr:hypothetical protein [Xylographa bjoerkii]